MEYYVTLDRPNHTLYKEPQWQKWVLPKKGCYSRSQSGHQEFNSEPSSGQPEAEPLSDDAASKLRP
jgi:hypothetical protein